jgi:hypothetical protein
MQPIIVWPMPVAYKMWREKKMMRRMRRNKRIHMRRKMARWRWRKGVMRRKRRTWKKGKGQG